VPARLTILRLRQAPALAGGFALRTERRALSQGRFRIAEAELPAIASVLAGLEIFIPHRLFRLLANIKGTRGEDRWISSKTPGATPVKWGEGRKPLG
jgi:hypothetical protein